MSDKAIKVAVNGYGIIGKRVADAVRLQPDIDKDYRRSNGDA